MDEINKLYLHSDYNAMEDVRTIVTEKAKELYGTKLHQIISDRLDWELHAIDRNGYAMQYMLAKNIVDTSSYPIETRGAVGSSLVAYLRESVKLILFRRIITAQTVILQSFTKANTAVRI